MTTKIWGTAGDATLIARSEWDTVFVGGVQLPGIARVQGKGIEYALEKKKTPGMDGATVTDLGREPAEFTVTLVLGGVATDWQAFTDVLPKLQPVRVENGRHVLEAVAITHPAINAIGVKSVKFKRVGVPHPGSVIGTFEVELECWEHRPAVAMRGAGTAGKYYDMKSLDEAGKKLLKEKTDIYSPENQFGLPGSENGQSIASEP